MNQIMQAVQALHQGGIIAYPTEAVYGLGCDPDNESAVQRLLLLKQRPMNKGLILIAATLEQLAPYLAPIPPQRMQEVLATWPGPFTWIFPAKAQVPTWIRGEHSGVAVRVTAHPIAQQLCLEFGSALVSTSANQSQGPPAQSVEEVNAIFPAGIEVMIEGELGGLSKPTEIRDALTGKIYRG
jgi:L-threonylcarbamoyladenylate synthase